MAETYDGNSHKMKETGLVRSSLNQDKPAETKDESTDRRVEKIVKGTVKTRKKTFGSKVAKAIFAEDLPDVKEHVVWDVMIPGIRDGIRNSLINIVESIFGGGFGGSKSSGTRVSYRGGGRDYSRDYDRPRSRRSEGMYIFEDVIFDNRGEAEAVKEEMQYNIERYHYVSVLDFYDMCGLRTRPSDANFGWTNIDHATVERVSGGYLLRLPDCMPIER